MLGLFYFFQHCQKHPLLNVIPKSIGIFKINIYLKKKKRILIGQVTYKSRPFKIFLIYLMVDIHFFIFFKKKKVQVSYGRRPKEVSHRSLYHNFNSKMFSF